MSARSEIIRKAVSSAGKWPQCSGAVEAVGYLQDAIRKIEKRARPHPDDTDEDRRRDLTKIQLIAKMAIGHKAP